MNVKFEIAMLYSGVFLLFSGAFGTLWVGSIIGDFLVEAAQLNNAHLNISTIPLMLLFGVGLSLIILSITLAFKIKCKESELAL